MIKLLKEVLDILGAAVIIGFLVVLMAKSITFALVFVAFLVFRAVTDKSRDNYEEHGI